MKKGYGAPTTSTIGEVGEKYLDLTTGDVYECTSVVPTERDMGFVSTYELYNAQFTWVKAAGGGTTHWDDLEGRPFGEETEKRELFTIGGMLDLGEARDSLAIDQLEEGRTYIVNFDGVDYEVTPYYTTHGDIPGFSLGNLSLTGVRDADDTGEPFFIHVSNSTYANGNRDVRLVPADKTKEPSATVYTAETVVTTIDPKFLPEPLQFGEEVVETPFIEAENLVEDATVVEGEYFDVGTQVRVYCSGTSFGELTVDTAVEEDGIHVVDPDKNLSVLIDVAVPGSWGVSYGEGSNRIDGILRVSTISKEVTPLDQKYIVLTSPNGTKYNLSVADDGTLSAVAAT